MGIGRNYVLDYLDCPLPIQVRYSNAASDKILVDGNTAAAIGAIYGGAVVCAWYPITPSTSLAEAFEQYCNRLRVGENGERNFGIIQAEDELAAMGIVIGAGWNGARAFTATSGPGLSLMTEFLGLAYFAEIPAVLWDIQRAGPSRACRPAPSKETCSRQPMHPTATRGIPCCSHRRPTSVSTSP